jgi:hypothetical protein
VAFSPLDRKQSFFVLLDGSNEVLETVRRNDGVVVGTFGRQGRNAGEFHYVHVGKFDSRGNFYTGEVDTGKRLQKWVRRSDDQPDGSNTARHSPSPIRG